MKVVNCLDTMMLGKIQAVEYSYKGKIHTAFYPTLKKEMHGSKICLVDPATGAVLSIMRLPNTLAVETSGENV